MGSALAKFRKGEAHELDGEEPAPATQQDPAHIHEAGIPQTVLNMLCNIVGGAVLALPTAMMNASILWGVLLLFVTCAASLSSIAMLTLCAHKLKKYTYKELLSIAVHEKFGKAFEVILFLYTFGVLVEYARIIADSMPDAVENLFHANGVVIESWLWLVIASVLFFFLSSMKSLSELTWSSVMGFGTIAFIVIMVIVRYFGKYERLPGEDGLNASDINGVSFRPSILQSIPVITMSFSCHYNVPTYYRELKGRSLSRMRIAAGSTMIIVLSLYLVNGVAGYLMFGNERLSKVHGDIVSGFSKSDLAINIGRLGLFFHFVCVYPIVALGCRRCLNVLIFNNSDQPRHVYFVEAFFLVSASCTLAYFVSGIAVVIEIIGSLFGMYIVFVLPGLMYVRVFRDGFTYTPPDEVGHAEQHHHDDHPTISDATTESLPLFPGGGPKSKILNPDRSTATFAPDALASEVPVVIAGDEPVKRNQVLFVLGFVFILIGALLSAASFSLTVTKIADGSH